MISNARVRLINFLGPPPPPRPAVLPVRSVHAGLVPFAGAHGQQYAVHVVYIVLGVWLVGEGQLQYFQQRQGQLGARVVGHYRHELQRRARAADHRGHEFQGDDPAVGPVLGLALRLALRLALPARWGILPALVVSGSGITFAFSHRIFHMSASLRMAFGLVCLSLQSWGRFAVRTSALTRSWTFIRTVALPRSRLISVCAA